MTQKNYRVDAQILRMIYVGESNTKKLFTGLPATF